MNKQGVLWALLDSVFLAVFNIVFYVAGGTDHPASVWLAYAFIHFAYLMVLATPLLIRKGPGAAIFGFSLYELAGCYFIVELVVGSVFIFLAQDDARPSVVVQVVVAGAYLALLLSHVLANEKTANSQVQKEVEVFLIKTAAARLQNLLDASNDRETARLIRKLYDAVRTRPTKSSAAVSQYEQALLESIGEMESAAKRGDDAGLASSAKRALDMIYSRNRTLRTMQ